ncbi:hypothetical protein [Amycolatopsis sp. RTGN1]|uniref:hypothetical protein n=1 Tax=Amycolatopsis ponsaeliensis TaxID=2992142 RepID=UPI00254D601D|nr:hypothetical protein [Amycolatopsis sp. RTGN1]
MAAGELTRQVAQRSTTSPRNVLGFYASVLGIILTGTVGIVTTLATTDTYVACIPWVLGFSGFLIVLTIISVLYINIKHPANLMLGQVSGSEYAEISRVMVLGNDMAGERKVVIAESGVVADSPPPGHLGRALPEDFPTVTPDEGADNSDA